MNTITGDIYENKQDAINAGVAIDNLVEVLGSHGNVMAISAAVKEDRRRKAKAARKSRKKNRGT